MNCARKFRTCTIWTWRRKSVKNGWQCLMTKSNRIWMRPNRIKSGMCLLSMRRRKNCAGTDGLTLIDNHESWLVFSWFLLNQTIFVTVPRCRLVWDVVYIEIDSQSTNGRLSAIFQSIFSPNNTIVSRLIDGCPTVQLLFPSKDIKIQFNLYKHLIKR